MIAGIGTDIVRISRLQALLSRFPNFKSHTYTAKEQKAGDARRENFSYYAGRWAAKEAAAKALGCGIGGNCSLLDLEILDDPQTGAPHLTLSGRAAETATRLGVSAIHVSISHEIEYATAFVILES